MTKHSNLCNNMHDYKLMNPIYQKIKNSFVFKRTNLNNNQINTFMGYLFNTQVNNLEDYNNQILTNPDNTKQLLYKSLSTLYSSLLNGTGLLDTTISLHNKIYKECDNLSVPNPFKVHNRQIRSEYFDYLNQTPIELCVKNIQWINRIAKVAKYSRNDCIYKYCNGNLDNMNKFFTVYKKLLIQVPEPGKEPILDTFLKDYSKCIENNKEPDMKAYSSIVNILKNNINKDLEINPKYKDKYNDKYLLETFYSFVSNEYSLERLYELKHSHTSTMFKEYVKDKEFYDTKGYSFFCTDHPEKTKFESILYVDIPEYLTPFSFHMESSSLKYLQKENNIYIDKSQDKIPPFKTTLVYKMSQENQKNLAKIAYDKKSLEYLSKKITRSIDYYKKNGLVQNGLDLLKIENEKIDAQTNPPQISDTQIKKENKKKDFKNSLKSNVPNHYSNKHKNNKKEEKTHSTPKKETNQNKKQNINNSNQAISKKQKKLQEHKEKYYDGDER